MPPRRWLLAAGTAVVFFLASSLPAAAAPGDLDPLFSGDGMTVISLGAASGTEGIEGLVVQSDSRSVGVGFRKATARSDRDLLVVRLTASGSPDPTFSGNGWTTVELPGNAVGTDVALQSDDKIVVVSRSGTGPGAKVAVVRLRPSGTFDPTFAGDGIRLVDLPGAAYPEAVEVLSNGKILVAGRTGGADSEMLVLRLTTGGAVDRTFGNQGRRLIDFEGQGDRAHAIRVQSDGKILLAGRAEQSSDSGFGVARLTPAGELDDTFSGDGRMRVNTVAGSNDYAIGLTMLPGGSILMGGRTRVAGVDGHALLRVTSAGSRDGTFGINGFVVRDPLSSDDYAGDVIPQLDGKLVFVGGHAVADGYDFEVVRYRTDGGFDTTFGGGDGVTGTPFPGSAVAQAAALIPSGKIVAAGRRIDGSDDLALARYRVV